MAFKMKGSPAKMGKIQGTAGHASALKHSGADYAAEVEKEIGKDKASKYDYKKGHDEIRKSKSN